MQNYKICRRFPNGRPRERGQKAKAVSQLQLRHSPVWYESTCLTALLFSFAVAAKHVDDFVLVESFHLVACRTEIFARVELCGLVVEYFTHSSCHCQTAVGVDIDLAHIHLGGLAELVFGNADGIGQFAAKLIDGLHIFLGH